MLPWLSSPHPNFPTTSQALASPNGLLAAGGELSPAWLVEAYRQGIFPWFSDDDPISVSYTHLTLPTNREV